MGVLGFNLKEVKEEVPSIGRTDEDIFDASEAEAYPAEMNKGGPNSSYIPEKDTTKVPETVPKQEETDNKIKQESVKKENESSTTQTNSTPESNKTINTNITETQTPIKYPNASAGTIMGLPPLWKEYDTDLGEIDLMRHSFPILRIQPIEVKLQESSSDKKYRTQLVGQEYEFAVRADNAIGYSHTNNFSPSGITNDLKQLITLNTAGELRQMIKTSGGIFLGGQMQAALNSVQEGTRETIEALGHALRNSTAGTYMFDSLGAVGTDVLNGLLLGARIDLPNIWMDSQTGMSWTFTIELRTMATKPSDEAYQREILLPLEVLLRLSLPVSAASIAYLEPPYVKFELGSFLKCRMGGIAALSWQAPLNEFNMYQVPRHIEVSLTLVDLFNVMVQGDPLNQDVPTDLKFLEQMKSIKGSIPNKAQTIFLTEYTIKGGGRALDAQSKMIAEYAPSSIPGTSGINDVILENAFSSNFKKSFLEDNLLSNLGTNLSFDPLTNDLNLISSELGTKLGTIPNLTELTGNIDFGNILAGIDSLPIGDISNMSLDVINKLDLNTIQNTIGSTIANINSGLLSDVNISKLTNGLTSIVPTNLFEQIVGAVSDTMGSLIEQVDTSSSELGSMIGIVQRVVGNFAPQINAAINTGTTDLKSFVNNVTNDIKNNDQILDIALRASNLNQNTLQKTCSSLVDSLSRTDVLNEVTAIKTQIQSNLPDPSKIESSFVENMTTILKTEGVVVNLGIIEAVSKESTYKSRNAARTCAVEIIV